MTTRLKKLAISKGSRRIIVKPQIVVEVNYDEVQTSPKYKCGMALRFARIARIRYDKSSEEVDTIQRVRRIYRSQPKQKSQH